ncbi:MAG: hypothetical protein IJ555_04585 [Ruminococcus sp.]|nr:hypothetical protein [Ruminococcus sp.]
MKDHTKFVETESYFRLKENDEELLDIISRSFELLYTNDVFLINNSPDRLDSEKNTNGQIGSLHHVGERAIVFRFGYYLQKQLETSEYKDLNVDCEYNRNGKNPKNIPGFLNGVYPDIIIHKRGLDISDLLVIEFKTYWNPDTRKDTEKILKLIDPDGCYKYKYGMSVVIQNDYAVINTLDHE